MFADDNSIENIQQLFSISRNIWNYKEIYPTGSSGEVNHITLNAHTRIVGHHSRHGGFVLSLLHPGLYIRPYSGRINGKFAMISCFHILLIILIVVFRKKIIINPMTKFIAGLFIDNNKTKYHEYE